jgi:hypothetical protein
MKRPTPVLIAGDVTSDRARGDVEIDQEVCEISHKGSLASRARDRIGEAPGDFGSRSLIFHLPAV